MASFGASVFRAVEACSRNQRPSRKRKRTIRARAHLVLWVVDATAADAVSLAAVEHEPLAAGTRRWIVVNKLDLAPHVGADPERMRADLALVRPGRPSLFTDLRGAEGARRVYEHLCRNVLFDRALAGS